MINNIDLQKIAPYLKGCINMEVKQYPKYREIMLEYTNGKKLIGNLNDEVFQPRELRGLSSLAENFARGHYGSNAYRGNFSGLLLKDLFEYYNPKFVIDPMVGSGTTKTVCNEMGINCLALDLNPKWGGFDALTMELDCSSPFIMWHPPYMAFEGSSMPRYSGVMWGSEKLEHDGSHITDPFRFTKWMNTIQAKLYQALRKGGHMAILMGDSRYKGQYYSMYKNIDIYGTVEAVLVKREYNCLSERIKYSGKKFIPIEFETLLIIRKDHEYNIPMLIVKRAETSVMCSEKISWRALIQSVIEHLGGKATKEQIYEEVKKHPKSKENNHLQEKIRQVINTYTKEFQKNSDGTVCLA